MISHHRVMAAPGSNGGRVRMTSAVARLLSRRRHNRFDCRSTRAPLQHDAPDLERTGQRRIAFDKTQLHRRGFRKRFASGHRIASTVVRTTCHLTAPESLVLSPRPDPDIETDSEFATPGAWVRRRDDGWGDPGIGTVFIDCGSPESGSAFSSIRESRGFRGCSKPDRARPRLSAGSERGAG